MHLLCRSISGKITDLDVNDSITIKQVKDQIALIKGLESQFFSLFYKASLLSENTILSELNIKPNEYLLIYNLPHEKIQNLISKREIPTPKVQHKKSNIPPRSSVKKPKNYEKMISKLENLGFEKEKCIKALIASSYNVDRAANYLFDDSIPEIGDFDEKQFEEDFNKITEIPVDAPADIMHFKPEFQENDIEILNHLILEGFNKKDAVQIYMACGQDIILARNLLLSFV
ncbi:UBA/TS-N domain containing protein [Trichomonas vaginalis G3]|uniref:UBA/TS-N domain containing protein n=1 Tax=Trichomonas vaginalis (strain ATCC PRA-98 / G3) TaxID=412133 RepID=A2EXF8_TRIV3|nr:UV excision repair protein RAD23 family [Trichomonas vaginalis G3]EAY02648.1 UBA/TS-N domain containing protein [Trichomonas vaginalis G3]KAI5550145.1 UV excision repair protein RAD23 family [Trichomonas vaginalis G3]|eukprot:XP_001314871.1 UBA/TS-N domain containing protein [Trichomonas vaginalis G3]